MATVIDSLIVTLGMDPTSYKKGVADATRANKSLKENTKKSGREVQGSLKETARQVALLVIGFQTIKGAVSALVGINNADAALGRLATNTGTSARELNQWGLAVELAGGDAKEAHADVSNLASSITSLKATGEVSPLLLLMQRLGVAIFDAEGNTRDLFTVMREAGDQLSQFDRADAFQLAKNSGLSEGTLNLLLLEEDARRRIFDQAEANNNLDQAAADRAAGLQRQWRDIAQGARAFGRELLETITPAAAAFADAISPAADSLRSILNALQEARVGEALGTAISGIAATFAFLVEQIPKAQRALTDFLEFVDKPRGYLSGKLTNLIEVVASPVDGTNTPMTSQEYAAYTTAGYREIMDRYERPGRAAGGGAGARKGAAGAGGDVSVQIDNISVNTQATDAQGIAAELPGALRRKGVVSQADTGMN